MQIGEAITVGSNSGQSKLNTLDKQIIASHDCKLENYISVCFLQTKTKTNVTERHIADHLYSGNS